MGAVVLREERESLTIDSPLAIAELCSEMRFLDRESLRVVLRVVNLVFAEWERSF